MKKIICICILTFIILVFLVFSMALFFTPKPLFKIVNFIPIQSNLTKPNNYLKIDKNTTVKKNITYSDKYSNSKLDIYYPKKLKERLPVVLFVHGGGFFKGKKEMAKYFASTIAYNKYAVISIDYELVPKVTILDQVKQLNEAIEFILENASKYSLDTNNINLSGSSAGGFLALQLVSAYYDKNYANDIQIKPVKNIKFNSLLLYSSVYDLSQFQKFNGNSLTTYLLSKVGWGLTGKRNWKNDKFLGEILNLNNYVGEDFPAIFVTDGNTNTFTKQAKKYVKRLNQNRISVQALFFDDKEKVGHGYQLKMDTLESEQAIEQSLKFLRKWN